MADGGRVENNENLPPFSATIIQEVFANVPGEDLVVAANAVRSGLLLIPPVNRPSISASQARRDKSTDTAKTLLLLARWAHYTGQKQK